MKMKLALAASILASAFTLSTALACSEDSQAKAKTANTKVAAVPASATTAAFRVEGMMCAGCEGRVREALNKVDGVYKVDVKMTDKRVVVAFDKAKTNADSIAKVMIEVGFKATAEV
jgi:copper chaperone CopZ